MNALFKGTTEACVARLNDAIQDDYLAKRHIVASFVGVNDGTVHRWLTGKCMPGGEPLVRLRFYLEFLGYEVEELQSLNPVVRDAARIYAFGVVSLEDIAPAVGYSEGRKGIDCVLRVFRGPHGVLKDKLRWFSSFVEEHRNQLAEKQRTTQKVILGNSRQSEKFETPSRPIAVPVRLGSRQPPEMREALIQSLAGSIVALIPIASQVESDDFTDEERAQLRKLAGGTGVFTLGNILMRLCGERRRSMNT